jgi:large subunit ribosomal protein L44
MMSDESLSDMSKAMGTTEVILCPDLIPSETVHANVLKAFIGNLAKENGEGHAQKFIIDLVLPYLQDKQIFEIWGLESVSTLKQILKNNKQPEYETRLLRETGRNTVQSCFVVGLYVEQKLVGSAAGDGLEVAEEMAAYDALMRMFEIRPSDYVFKFGPRAYDLQYDAFDGENAPLAEWSSSLFMGDQKMSRIL